MFFAFLKEEPQELAESASQQPAASTQTVSDPSARKPRQAKEKNRYGQADAVEEDFLKIEREKLVLFRQLIETLQHTNEILSKISEKL